MYNWSTNTSKLAKNKDKFTIWKLEQLINFGLNGELLSRLELKKFLPVLDIDPQKKKYLQFLLSE